MKGTKWEYKWDDSHDQYIDVETYTLTFNKTDFTLKFQAEYYEDSKIVKETESKTGTYTYDHPKVVLRSDGETETLTRSGNKLISDEEEDIIFTKK